MNDNSLNQLRTKCGILNATIKTTIHCDWLSYGGTNGKVGLEGIIKVAYGKHIDMEASNDTAYSHNIKKEVLSDYDQESLNTCIKNGSFPEDELRSFLIDLCNKDIIPEAHYVVKVSW